MTVEAPPTTLDAAALVRRLRATFATGRTKSFEWRDGQLDALAAMLTDGEKDIVDALSQDLGRPPFESWAADVQINVREFKDIKKHYRKWAGEQKMRTPAFFKPAKSSVRFDPLGTVLIISPWNYPVQLLVSPLAAAIAAGNTAVCKPSELAPATSEVLVRLADQYLDPEAIVFVEGGIPESTALLEQRWDHILYTGNGAVGRVVATAAAKHLTPVTLELGGQSPTIVAEDANLTLAVERIASGRFINAGQTCVAPNHVFIHESVEDEFVEKLKASLKKRYGKDPRASKDFARIVNERHTERIAGLIAAGGYDEIAYGGESSVAERYVAPTVLRGVKPDAPVMQEEIFGPVLPLIPYSDLSEPIAAINAGEKPLALYVFTRSDETKERVLNETSSGGVCVNDTVLHVANGELPFGGVGESGHGAYHGQTGFETFSHRKAVFHRPAWYRDPSLLRPPYTPFKQKLMRKIY
jgi:aldehyde dehydrogenase (NAD+)